MVIGSPWSVTISELPAPCPAAATRSASDRLPARTWYPRTSSGRSSTNSPRASGTTTASSASASFAPAPPGSPSSVGSGAGTGANAGFEGARSVNCPDPPSVAARGAEPMMLLNSLNRGSLLITSSTVAGGSGVFAGSEASSMSRELIVAGSMSSRRATSSPVSGIAGDGMASGAGCRAMVCGAGTRAGERSPGTAR